MESCSYINYSTILAKEGDCITSACFNVQIHSTKWVKLDAQCARTRPGLVQNQPFLLGAAENCSQKLLEVTQSNLLFIFSTEELQIQECSDLIIIKKKNPTPTWRRRRRRDIAEHEIQHGHKPLSQKCNLAISFAYLLVHLLLIWWNWGVVRVMWCKEFILQNNLQPTVQSL